MSMHFINMIEAYLIHFWHLQEDTVCVVIYWPLSLRFLLKTKTKQKKVLDRIF